MKIVWAENPLKSSVILNKQDESYLKTAIESDLLKWMIVGTEYWLKESDKYEPRVLISFIENEIRDFNNIEDLVEERFTEYSKILQDGYSHLGDCTYQACTCSKCLAEDLLNINTIEGLNPAQAYRIDCAFKDANNIDQAILNLKNYNPKGPGFEEYYYEIWKNEAAKAHDWLVSYKNNQLRFGVIPF